MIKNKLKYPVILILGLFIPNIAFSQTQNHEMTQDEYEVIKDQYAVMIIELMIRLDTLKNEVEILKQISGSRDSIIDNYETNLYALVGTTKSGADDFRRKFDETEKRISGKTGSPADARRNYFDEIESGNIRCLPEFQERYISMKKKLEDWEGTQTTAPVIAEGNYTVVKGDCLWKISTLKYGSPYYWPVIWEANKNGVVNKNELPDPRHKAVTNPNLIYPGQVLKIQQLNDLEINKEEFKERIKKFRKVLKETSPPQ
jgi:LysM repeat protein